MMLKFIYTEKGGRDIEMTYNDYPSIEDMCVMFADFVAAKGYDRELLAYAFEEEAFKGISIDKLCDEWREDVPSLEGLSPLEIVEATIDALVVGDKYYLRRLR